MTNSTVSKNEKLISKLSEKLFSLLGTQSKGEVSYDKENDLYLLNIDAGDEAGLLIGKKGDTINSLQILLNQIVRQKTGEWLKIVVDVADFREKEKSRMEDLAAQVAARVRETEESQNLYNLTPAQRRTVHLFLAEEKDLHTESVGEGESRYLVVSLNK